MFVAGKIESMLSKYSSRQVFHDGHMFDSLAEMRRYQDLRLMEASGAISDLEVHPRFEVLPAFQRGKLKVRAIVYEADFAYMEAGRRVVEDVKGFETREFRLKRKLWLYRYGDEYEFRLVRC